MSPDQLDIVIRPHRSLSPAGFWAIMTILAVWSFAGGIVFLLVGAWLVIGFVGIDVVLVWWAFRVSYGQQKAHERFRLDGGTLILDRIDKRGAAERVEMPAYWLRVNLERQQVVLSSHGRSLIVGAFLAPAERAELAELLRDTLARAKAAPLQG